MDFFARVITWINVPVNAMAEVLLAPIAVLGGWLSNTVISAVTGVVLLIILKYTSNQQAIGRVRDNIKANMLALKLFKDSMAVTLKAQGHVFKDAFLLLFHYVKPMLITIVPISLLLAQMSLWYQSRPLLPGEEVIVTVKLNGSIETPWPTVRIEPTPVAEVTIGPVRVFSQHQIHWKIRAVENGDSSLIFHVDEEQFDKELTIGDGFRRVSAKRPGLHWADIMLYPVEKPFGPDSVVQSINIDYPDRLSRTSGADWWVIYFFVASLVFALIFKPFLKVRI